MSILGKKMKKKALSFPKNSKERRSALQELQLKGNYHHNANIISTGEGSLIVCKRPQ